MRLAKKYRLRRALAALPLALALLSGCSSPPDEAPSPAPTAPGTPAAASAAAATALASASSDADVPAAPSAGAATPAAGSAPAASPGGAPGGAAKPSGAPASAAPVPASAPAKPGAGAKPRASAKPAQAPSAAAQKPADRTAAPVSGAASPRPAASQPAASSVTLSITGDSERGAILPPTEVAIEEGDSVLDVLKRVTRKHRIQMEFRGSGALGYVEGIDNLYEMDQGAESGWLFSVNGDFPDESSGAYTLKPGDTVEWRYTLDGGKDIGKTR